MYYTNEAFAFINTELFFDACGIEITTAPLDAVAIDLQNFIALANADLQLNSCSYRRKYETAGEIYRILATTSSRKEVASLYYVNADLILQDSELSKAFINRKAMFYPTIKAIA